MLVNVVLSRFTLIDDDREMKLVAVPKEPGASADGGAAESEHIVGVSRYVTNSGQSSCEFLMLVSDEFKCKGLRSRLLASVTDVARGKGLSKTDGMLLANNAAMLKLMTRMGFSAKRFAENPGFNLMTRLL